MIPRYIFTSTPFQLWKSKYLQATDYKTFIAGYDLYRLGHVTNYFNDMIQDIWSKINVVVLIGVVVTKKSNHQVIVDYVKPLLSVCSCTASHFKRDRFCKHIIAVLLAAEKTVNRQLNWSNYAHPKEWLNEDKTINPAYLL